MLIRSQKKDALVEMTGTTISIYTKRQLETRFNQPVTGNIEKDFAIMARQAGCFTVLGYYDTVERCIEILDDVQSAYNSSYRVNFDYNGANGCAYKPIGFASYDMPER